LALAPSDWDEEAVDATVKLPKWLFFGNARDVQPKVLEKEAWGRTPHRGGSTTKAIGNWRTSAPGNSPEADAE
jgi:hypothetical protein